MFDWFKNLFRKVEPERLYFQEDQLLGLYQRYDAYVAKERGDNTEKFQLWQYIAEIFPEVKNGEWFLYTYASGAENVFKPFVERAE